MSWVGVDLDRTLAHYDEWRGPAHIGKPILPMVNRVRALLADGVEVRLFTARADESWSKFPVFLAAWEKWSEEMFGEILPVTNKKDFQCVAIFDDIAIRVAENKGVIQ